MAVRVQREDFDPGAEITALTENNTGIGAVSSFIGLVRDISDGTGTSSMTLEHYPGMTERMLQEIESEALDRWKLDATLIIHRYGRLLPGDRIVLVVTASRHRKEALEACAFLIDWLKTRAPFWKLETTDEGSTWVEARQSDTDATERWSKTG